jgi:uncharacterized coiled-coil protein SlyX
MNDINPREFGRLEAQVQHLMASMAEQTDLLAAINDRLTAQDKLIEQARGGYRALAWLLGAAATLGGAITASLTWIKEHLP